MTILIGAFRLPLMCTTSEMGVTWSLELVGAIFVLDEAR